MKLSIAVFFSALGFVKGSSLRAATNEDNNSNHKILGSQIVLGGTSGEPTKEDSDFLARALVASYNNVHWEVGHYMTGVDSAAFQASSSTSSGVFEVETPVLIWLWPGFLCRHCPDDDAMGAAQQSLLLQAVTEDCAGLCHEEATAELESNFCDRIQSSSSDYLKSADSCSITFNVNKDENNNSSSNEKPAAPETVATIGSTIILKGAGAGETTQEEKALLAKAFVSAYNDVHWDANHYLSDAEIPFVANSDFANENASINTLVLEVQTPVLIWLWPGFLCRHCPDDDAMGTNLVNADELKLDAEKKAAVEKLFLQKIQNSVSTKLEGTQSVSFAIDSVVSSSETKTW